MYQPLIDYAQK